MAILISEINSASEVLQKSILSIELNSNMDLIYMAPTEYDLSLGTLYMVESALHNLVWYLLKNTLLMLLTVFDILCVLQVLN